MKFISYLLSAVVFFTTADSLMAQTSYIIAPNDTVEMNGKLDDLETMSIHQINSTNDTLILKWKKISVVLPSFWDANICDNSTCYTSLLDSGIMNPVVVGDYGFLIVHITPHQYSGTAIIKYEVWDTTTTHHDTLTFILHVNQLSGIHKIENQQPIIVFPNPSDNFIHLTYSQPIETIEIINANAESCLLMHHLMNNTIDISKFTKGNYFIKLTSNGKTITQKFIRQ